MGETSDQLKADIAGTRADMTATLDAITHRANPRYAARRQASRLGRRATSLRDTVMGTIGEASDRIGDTMSDRGSGTANRVRQGPDEVMRRTQGSPLAAGLMAFGAGLLVAAVIPSSEPERRAASSLSDQAQPLIGQARDAAQQLTHGLQSSARQAAEQVKETASEAAGQVRQDASDAAEQVRAKSRAGADDVKGAAREHLG